MFDAPSTPIATPEATAPSEVVSLKVGIGVRIVPAGIATVGGQRVVRASLLLSPIAAKETAAACGTPIDLSEWPERVERLLRSADVQDIGEAANAAPIGSGLQVLLSRVGAGTDRPSPAGDDPEPLAAFRAMYHDHRDARDGETSFETWRSGRRDDVEKKVAQLWGKLVAPGAGDWEKLHTALAAMSATDSLKSLRGSGNDPTTNPPDIRSVGRGEAALLFGIERAGSLLNRLARKRNGSDCIDRSDECNLVASDLSTNPNPPRPGSNDRVLDIKQSQVEQRNDKVRDADDRTTRAAKAQVKLADALNKVRASGLDRAGLADAYQALLGCMTETGSAACISALAAGDGNPITKALKACVDRHEDAARRPPPNEPWVVDKDERHAPLTRLHSLQTQPSLARLFNLVVDVLIPFETFEKAAGSEKMAVYLERPGIAGTSRFGFLSASIAGCGGKRRVWTTTKIRLPADSDGKVADVWACTHAELDLFAAMSEPSLLDKRDELIAGGALPQIDGVVDLGASRVVDGKDRREARFDIVTVDAFQATEALQTAQAGSVKATRDLLSLRSAGMAIVDRWRADAALAQALSALSREAGGDEVVVDAQDLTLGYRMDVALGTKGQTARDWRSLCNRSIAFGDDDDCVGGFVSRKDLEALLSRAIPDPDWRASLDAAALVLSAKTTVRKSDNSGGTAKAEATATAHVDDTVGLWAGPPIGVDANSSVIDLSTTNALRLTQVYRLSPRPDASRTARDAWFVPNLAFGNAFHFGLAARLRGGVSRPVEDCYTRAGEERAVLPAPSQGPRRFLRHERIEAPFVATPLGVLERRFDRVADGLHETGKTVIVRSRWKDASGVVPDDAPNAVANSFRVVVPPSVSAAFADRHGVFKDIEEDDLVPYVQRGDGRESPPRLWHGPKGGLLDVDYDDLGGGFPSYGFLRTSEGAIEPTPPAEVDSPTRASRSGDAIFRRPVADSGQRRVPYYPDPAATYFVIAARDLAGRLLSGDPLVVPIRPNGVKFPDVRPVAIDIVADRTRSGTPLSQKRVLGLEMKEEKGKELLLRGAAILDAGAQRAIATVRIDGDTIRRSGDGIAASRVEVRLEPGESLEIDIWCLPTKDDLAKWFDVIETGALLASYDPDTGEACTKSGVLDEQRNDLGLDQLRRLIEAAGRSHAASNGPLCAAGQASVSQKAVLSMAGDAMALLKARPTPELAARFTIAATHAIDKPLNKPKLTTSAKREGARTGSALAGDGGGTLPQPITVHRVSQETRETFLKSLAAGTKPALPVPAEPKATDVLVLGSAWIDRPSTGFFEIDAEAACLVSNGFDDERRKRSADEVARGLWPVSAVTGKRLTPKEVYGFDVCPDGRVRLTPETATLLRVDEDIPDESKKENLDLAGRALAEIQAIPFGPADEPSRKGPRAVQRFTIGDTRARVLSLRLKAGSRTAWCFRSANGDLLAGKETQRESDPLTIALPATKAPAKVAPLTIRPAFRLVDEPSAALTFTVRRSVKLRIRVRRPWFSSGEGERLGLVLWPPDIARNRIDASASHVTRDYDVAKPEHADIDMTMFDDLDLGPGGPYVTRWGRDPIKGEDAEPSWLMPRAVFSDLESAYVHADEASGPRAYDPADPKQTNVDVVYVPRASMPIPADLDGDRSSAPDAKGSGDSDHAARPARLEVALIAYQPRFDVDREEWYCDVALNPGVVPEPFVRLGLVRYQPNALPDLRVSEPVVEWLQLPNDRRATVRVDPKTKGRLEVRIEGVGKTHAAADPSGHDDTRVETWLQRPIMKVSVVHRRASGIEETAEMADGHEGARKGFSRRAERTAIPTNQNEWSRLRQAWDDGLLLKPLCGDAAGIETQPATANSSNGDTASRDEEEPRFSYPAIRPEYPGCDGVSLSWSTSFLLAADPLRPQPGESFAVLVEEMESMPPSSFAAEPIRDDGPAPGDQPVIALWGPRFAARVEIRGPAS